MSAPAIEKKPSNGLSDVIIKTIAHSIRSRFNNFPTFTFSGTEYKLTSATGSENVYQHIMANLGDIPFSAVDIGFLNASDTINNKRPPQFYRMIGKISMNPSVPTAVPSIRSAVTGHNVVATGLCQLYFAAMTTRLVAFGWNAVTEATVAAVRLVDNAQSRIASPQGQVCMKDELVEGKLSKKAIALALRPALLLIYSDEELMEAMIDLHNSKAPFTEFLRKNSNVVSGIFGKDTHSWKEAVAQIKAEAQLRLNALGVDNVAAADEVRRQSLQSIVDYKSDLFSATVPTI